MVSFVVFVVSSSMLSIRLLVCAADNSPYDVRSLSFVVVRNPGDATLCVCDPCDATLYVHGLS